MKPFIALTIGDPNGIGPEVALKAVSHPDVMRICSPILVGPWTVFRHYAAKLDLPLPRALAVHDVRSRLRPRPGNISPAAGRIAYRSLVAAGMLVGSGVARAMVTAPVCKESLRKAGFQYPGQTEFLRDLTLSRDAAMVLASSRLKIGLVTIHVPVRSVSKMITQTLLRKRLRTIRDHLVTDWGIRSPEIAVLGLNPHAGERGQIGDEERRVIRPVIRQLSSAGMRVSGPFPADSFFSAYRTGRYDMVVAMYHDQGLIPLKMAAGGKAVNITAGLPIVRTSPDHGTAFDIAGKGKANPASMVEAVKTAVGIASRRERMHRR